MGKVARTLPIAEAAQQLGVSVPTAYRWALSGELPAIKLGRRILVLRAPFERLLSGRQPQRPHDAA